MRLWSEPDRGPRYNDALVSATELSMATRIQRVDYFYTTIGDSPGEAWQLLSQLAELGVDLLAFTAIPIGVRTQLTMFPADAARLQNAARQARFTLDGPHPAILVQGDDRMGALAEIHNRLAQAGVSVFASSGVADGKGSYGYVVYVRPERFAEAMQALEL